MFNNFNELLLQLLIAKNSAAPADGDTAGDFISSVVPDIRNGEQAYRVKLEHSCRAGTLEIVVTNREILLFIANQF